MSVENQSHEVLELGRDTVTTDGHAVDAAVKSFKATDLKDAEVMKYLDGIAGGSDGETVVHLDARQIEITDEFLVDLRLKQRQYAGRLEFVLDGVDAADIDSTAAQLEGEKSTVVRTEDQMRKASSAPVTETLAA